MSDFEAAQLLVALKSNATSRSTTPHSPSPSPKRFSPARAGLKTPTQSGRSSVVTPIMHRQSDHFRTPQRKEMPDRDHNDSGFDSLGKNEKIFISFK